MFAVHLGLPDRIFPLLASDQLILRGNVLMRGKVCAQIKHVQKSILLSLSLCVFLSFSLALSLCFSLEMSTPVVL